MERMYSPERVLVADERGVLDNAAVDELHHEKLRPKDGRIVAEQQAPRDRHVRVLQGGHDSVLLHTASNTRSDDSLKNCGELSLEC